MVNTPGYQITASLQRTNRFHSYRAIRLLDQLPVILKRPADLCPSGDELRRFKYEYEILGKKDISGTVRILGLTKYDLYPALVYEDVTGIPCSELIHTLPGAGTWQDSEITETIPISDFLAIAINATQALAAVHQHDIVHRNIEPANLLVNRDTSEVHITGFRSATLLTKGTTEAIAPTLLDCSLSYVSPEQTGRMNRALDYRTDLYSLGVSFYQLLTGRLPFVSDDPMELVHCHLARVPQMPRNLNPGIPAPLSDIVMKLLAKTAEDRYQSAYGLLRDLQHCRDQIEHTGPMEPFVLAKDDFSNRLQVPEKLYGRTGEIHRLLAAFERMIQTGRAELVLVTGYSGIGKTSLVREVHKPIVAQRGYFISGKYDLLSRDAPYSALLDAFRDLVHQILTEREAVVCQWRQRLSDKLGPYGQVLIDVIPDLELIIGPQPPVPVLGPTESMDRFDRVFLDFVAVIAQREHPLTIFLDDLQWVDAASLRIIRLLTSNSHDNHLLLIGAYRDNEVNQSHPFMQVLDAIAKTGVTAETIVLTPLQRSHVTELLTDTLHCSNEATKPLATILMEKTLGNPFFLRQMLTSFANKGLLAFNLDSGQWEWEQTAIQEARIADNVLDLMTEKLHALPSQTQGILQLAACIGNRFSLTTLAIICEQKPQETLDRLWQVIRIGLVFPVGQSTWLIGDNSQGREFDEIMPAPDASVNDDLYEYQFLHDQVQKAAYELIPAEKKQSVHLKIGRLMKVNRDADHNRADLFDIVNHLNFAARLIDSPGERIDLAQMNLDAALKAKSATAYQAALDYTETGMQLLDGEAGWNTSYELAFSLHSECAECRFLCRQFDEAESLLQDMLRSVTDTIDHSRIHSQQILILLHQGRIEDTLSCGREALRALEIDFSTNPTEAQWQAQDAQFRALRGNRTIASLVDGPRLDSPRMQAAMDILLTLVPSMYTTRSRRPHGLIYLITMALNISLEYGYCDTIGYAFATYGSCITDMDRYQEAYEYGKLGLAINERFANFATRGRTTAFFTCSQYWRKPFSQCQQHWDLAYSQLRESGDYSHANFIAMTLAPARITRGINLIELHRQTSNDLAWIQPMGSPLCCQLVALYRQLVANLRGQTADRFSLDGDGFTEAAFLRLMEGFDSNPMGLAYYYSAKLLVNYLYGQPRQAIAAAEEYRKHELGVPGLSVIADSGFYYALAISATYADMQPSEQTRYWAQLEALLARLKIWADNCPENFLNRYLLVAAEIARIDDRPYEAMALYDRAIASARENQFPHIAAVANELAATFYQQRGRMQLARAYMADARNAYMQWGAAAKVAQLDEAYRAWWQTDIEIRESAATDAAQKVTEHLDLMTIVQASRVLSGEIMLETLLDKIMTETLHHAGAEHGCLLLADGDDMRVAVLGGVRGDTIEITQKAPLAQGQPGLYRKIVDHTYRTGAMVVVGDAENDICFANEPYVQANQVKSILCLPIGRQDETTAILYLENNTAANTFTPDRVELLKVIAVQAAISLENAGLYRELKTLNNSLEDLVEERTEELRVAQKELLDKAHKAGMAEVSAETVHNVGNLLNSVVTALKLLEEQIQRQPHKGLTRANALVREQRDHLDEFFARDPRGRKLINYYFEIEKLMGNTNAQFAEELKIVRHYVSQMQGVIYAQQSYAGSIALEQSLDLAELVEQFLLLEDKSIVRNHIKVHKQFSAVGKVTVQKTKLMHVLINLFENAKTAMAACEEKCVSLDIAQKGNYVLLSVSDNGCGIPPELGDQIFRHGFTTKPNGRGFGLHSCMNYMREMNGDISATSAGPGCGATFVLTFPVALSARESHRLVGKQRLGNKRNHTNTQGDTTAEQKTTSH